jgi:hypothetical protein
MEDLLREISHDPYLFQINDFVDSGWIGHAPFLKFLIRELKPSLFVELGIHNGFSYFVGCQAISECNLEAKAFAVDHWKGDQQAGFFDNSVYESVKMLNSKYSNFSSILNVSFEDALNDFFDSSIDVLHIDGYHSYESVKNDFESWLPKLKKDGVILLHDISVRRDTFGVHKLWAEIKMQHNTIEFVGSHGLGVVFLGKIPVGRLRDLVEYSQAGNSSQVQGIFGSIADDVIQNFRYLKVQTVIAERDRVIAERDRVIAERDRVIAERDRVIDERDRVIAERDRVIAERDAILNSRIWRCFSAYRKAKNLLWGS